MLHQTPKTTPYIYTFKLSTGEEVIARVEREDDTAFYISKPMQLVMGPNGPQLAPAVLMFDQKKSLRLNKALVLIDGPCMAEVEGQYESLVTGIALPQKSSIITG